MKKFSKNKTPYNFYINLILLSLGLCLFLGINNYIYLKRCAQIFCGDQTIYLTDALFHHNNGTYLSFLENMRRGPAPFTLIGILFNIFPANEITAILSNLFFAFFLFLFTYLAGYKISQNKTCALDATLLVTLYPITFGLSRFFLSEFALMAAVCGFIFFLISAHNFKNKLSVYFLGLCMGMGVLTKESFFIFTAGPLIWQLYQFKNAPLDKKQLKNISVCVIISLLCSVWFFRSLLEISDYGLQRLTLFANNQEMPPLSWKNVFFYFSTIINFSLAPVFTFAFLFSLIRFRSNKYFSLFLLWIIFPCIFFSFFPWKLARYIAPTVPAMAIITAYSLNSFKSKKLKQLLRFTYIAFGLLQFFVLTHGNVFFLREKNFNETDLFSHIFNMLPYQYKQSLIIQQPYTQDDKVPQILKSIKKAAKGEKNIKICRIFPWLTLDKNDRLPAIHEFKTPLSMYNLSLKYNFDISYSYLLSDNKLYLWPPRDNPVLLEKQNIFDFFISSDTLDFKDETYTMIERIPVREKETIYIYKLKK